MTKYSVFLIIFLIVGLGFGYYTFFIYRGKVDTIDQLDTEIVQQEEQLISAQLLNREVEEVALLIERNLAMSHSDSLVKERSLDFLKYLTPILDKYNITMLGVEPNRTVEETESSRFYQTTHDLRILCNYNQFGKFVAELERSDRLTTIRSFHVENSPYAYISPREDREPDTYEVKLTISTLTLVKDI